jgi:hypothetical protein
MRFLNEIPETTDQVIAAPVGYEQRPAVIRNLHESGLIALGRAIETLLATSGENQERRGGNKRAASRIDVIKVFFEDTFGRLCVKRC